MRTSLVVAHRRGQPEIGKLLYGRKKNTVHQRSPTRMSAPLLLERESKEDLAGSVKHALSVKELSQEDLLAALRSNRSLKRLDRNEIIYQAVKESQPKMLNSYHFSLLMAHANDERNSVKALQFWEDAVRQQKINPKLHGALLQAYRNDGKWSSALQHCDTMFDDKVTLDAHGLHSVLNCCRKNAPWYVGLQFFSKAVKEGSRPNPVVYLELLRLVEQARPLPGRWQYGLAILDALRGKIDVTAGHYNAVLTTLGGSQWERGVSLYHSMQEHDVFPSKETLSTLLLLQPHNISHTIRCIAEAHHLGMPVTDTMYRALLMNLIQRSLDHEAVQFIEKELSQDRKDTGNPVRTTLPLMVALLDSLLAHPRPHDARTLLEMFESNLGDVVGPASRNLGEMGTTALRWIVQGRVAVVDHNVILSPRFQSLIHHYDTIFIPFSSVRLLVRRERESGDSKQGRYMRMVLLRLAETLSSKEWRMIRVIPLSHQILSHTYIAEETPFSAQALEEMRDEAKKIPTSFGQRLLDEVSSVKAEPGTPTVVVRDAEAVALMGKGEREKENKKKRASFIQSKGKLSSVERVLAVAVMMKTLNPEADVHVLSTNRVQLDLIDRWNQFSSGSPLFLQRVHYPTELMEKAPPPDASTAGTSAEAEKRETPEDGKEEVATPFIPS